MPSTQQPSAPPTTGPVVDFASAAEHTLRDLADRVGLDSWWVARPEGEEHVVLAAVDPLFGLVPGSALPWRDTHCRRVLEEDAPAAAGLPGVPRWLAPDPGAAAGPLCVVSVALRGPHGEVLATLCGVGRGEVPGLSAAVPTLQLQGDVLGVLLAAELELTARARGLERAHQAERTDEVTGVASRGSWDAALAAEEDRAARYASPVSLVLLEVHDLQGVNRDRGFAAGDRLLRRAATVASARLRSADLIARLGGDRFGVLLPGTDEAGARALAGRVRAALAAEAVPARVGVATRRRRSGLSAAWSSAEAELLADVVTPVAPARPAVHPGPDPAASTTTALDALLDLARRQLGAELAFISTLDGDRGTLRNVVTPFAVPLAPGRQLPLSGTLCERVVRTGEPLVVPDTTVAEFAGTRAPAAGIHSYVGTPLRRRDGSLYGTLCAMSSRPDAALRDRDAEVLRAVAGAVMDLVEEEDTALQARRSVLARFDDLDAAGGPQVVYQPVVDLATAAHVGAEALSRFPQGTPTPDRWFADAADVGYGTEFELSAIENALRGLPRLPGFLALNLSPTTITTPGFRRLLAGRPLDRLVVEITEHAEIADYPILMSALEPLRSRGLRVAVDDTGAGYASLRHVLAILPDFIKLDISLVRDIDSDLSRRALTAGLVTFARSTGAHIIAEGIETAAELAALRDLGVSHGQGYHLARPAPLLAA